MQGLRWPSLKLLSSTGEASAPDDYHWLMALASYRAPVIEYCGGTELAGAFITGTSLQPAAPSTFTTPSLGTQVGAGGALLVSHGCGPSRVHGVAPLHRPPPRPVARGLRVGRVRRLA